MTNSFDSWDSELQHFGIKGMRWGIRRYMNKDGTLTSEGAKRYGGKVGSKSKRLEDDLKLYGARGAERIRKRMKEKRMTRKKAERREFGRQLLSRTGMSIAATAVNDEVYFGGAIRKTVGMLLKSVGNQIVNDINMQKVRNAIPKLTKVAGEVVNMPKGSYSIK